MGLILKNISKRYGAVVAIKHADLEVQEGEVRAILGGNGSGKSTLAKIVSGSITKNSGTIEYHGKNMAFCSPADAKRHHFIMTSQELSLFGHLTVEENICISNPPKKYGLFEDRKKIKAKAFEILEKMGLEHLIGEKVISLAPNQQYMIELAKALVQEPRVLMIDEITSALYRSDVQIVDSIIRELKEKGVIVLFISHRMEELYAMCDSVTIMRNGETFGTYPMHDKTENELLSLMVGSKIDNSMLKGRKTSQKSEEVLLEALQIPIVSYGTSIDMKVYKGEIIGVAGLQGHGQVDMVNALFGMNGAIDIKIGSDKTTIHNPRQAVSCGFAYISGDRERDGTFRERNITENITVVQELVKKKKMGDPSLVLDSFHVKYDKPNALITSLSGGNQQKVVVGRWLAAQPRVILANDPTKGIDVKARSDLHILFADLAKKGNAVIMISSDDDELVKISNMSEISRVIVMYEGKISAVLEGDDITRENISAASMPLKKEDDE